MKTMTKPAKRQFNWMMPEHIGDLVRFDAVERREYAGDVAAAILAKHYGVSVEPPSDAACRPRKSS